MIFAKTIDLALSGRKTQTCRLAYAGDFLAVQYPGCVDEVFSVLRADGRPRWMTGHTYAIQRERCHPAEGRFLCTYLREVINPTAVDDDFVNAEGYDDQADYLRIWHELHRKQPVQRCWAIGMELVRDA